MPNASTILSNTVSQQPLPAIGRSYRGIPEDQPEVKKASSSAHSALCACAGCFPDPIG